MSVKSDRDVIALFGKLAAGLDADPGLLIQTGPTLLYSIHLVNTVAGVSYIQLFNAAALTDVVIGTTTPNLSIPIAASSTLHMDLCKPLYFNLGLCAYTTTTATGSTDAVTHGTFYYA